MTVCMNYLDIYHLQSLESTTFVKWDPFSPWITHGVYYSKAPFIAGSGRIVLALFGWMLLLMMLVPFSWKSWSFRAVGKGSLMITSIYASWVSTSFRSWTLFWIVTCWGGSMFRQRNLRHQLIMLTRSSPDRRRSNRHYINVRRNSRVTTVFCYIDRVVECVCRVFPRYWVSLVFLDLHHFSQVRWRSSGLCHPSSVRLPIMHNTFH